MSYTNTKSSAAVPSEYSAESQPAGATQISQGPSNVYGFYVEENGGSADAFLCLYDSANAGSIVPGTTPVSHSYRIKAGQGFGKDAVTAGLHHYSSGCVALVAANRDGSSPTSGDTVKIWFKGNPA